jgi:hypothetical protein
MQAFQGCSALSSVTIQAPSLTNYGLLAFALTPSNMRIYVPAQSVNIYKEGWPDYARQILPIEGSNINSVKDRKAAPTKKTFYDIGGKQIWQPKKKGINILQGKKMLAH